MVNVFATQRGRKLGKGGKRKTKKTFTPLLSLQLCVKNSLKNK